jgi:hypothetical protein
MNDLEFVIINSIYITKKVTVEGSPRGRRLSTGLCDAWQNDKS